MKLFITLLLTFVAVSQACDITPDACKLLGVQGSSGGGTATDVHLQLSTIVNPETYCGDSPYELSNLNLLNLTAQFKTTTSGFISVGTFVVKDVTTGIPNVLTAVYLSAYAYVIGDVITLNAIIAPPGGGVWQNHTYTGTLTNLLGQVIWCREGDISAVLL